MKWNLKKPTGKTVVLILVFALAFAACLFLIKPVLSLKEPENQAKFRAFVDSLGVWGVLLMFALQVAQIIAAVVPGEPFELLMGLLYGTVPGLFLTLAGIAAGSLLVWFAAKRLGRRFTARFADPSRTEDLTFLRDPAKRDPLLFLLFFLPGTPKDLFIYFAPMTGVSLPRFLLLSVPARIPSVVTSTMVGDAVAEGGFTTALLIYLATGLAGLCGIFIQRAVLKRQNQQN